MGASDRDWWQAIYNDLVVKKLREIIAEVETLRNYVDVMDERGTLRAFVGAVVEGEKCSANESTRNVLDYDPAQANCRR